MHLELCLSCEAPPMPAPPRRRRRLEVRPAGDPARLEGLLVALGAERQLAASQVALDRFDLVSDLSSIAEARLTTLIGATGAECLPTERYVPAAEHAASWVVDGRGLAKLATVLGLGGAAIAGGVPWVPVAALVATVSVVVSWVRVVPRELALEASRLSARLEIDAGLQAEVHTVRRELRDLRVIELLRACVTGFLDAMVRLRASGAHLLLPELARADRQLLEQLRRTLTVCASAGRLSMAIADAPPERAAGLERSREGLLEELEHVPQRIAVLTASLALLDGAEARRELLAGPLGTLAELQHGLDAAAEIEQLLR